MLSDASTVPPRPATDSLHRTILMVDIEGYSRPARTNPIRGRLRDALYLLLDQAIGSTGIAADLHEPPQDQGDGALLLFLPQVPKNRLLHPLVTNLAEALVGYNAAVGEQERMRLRVVVHAGELLNDRHGYFGEHLDEAFGLVNSDMLRAHLALTTSLLVLLVSDQIYEGIVKHGLSGIDPATYRRVDVGVKGRQLRSWLHIPDAAPTAAVA